MGKRKAKRRKVTVEETTSSVDLEEGWVTKLLELPEDELAKLLDDIANRMSGRLNYRPDHRERFDVVGFGSRTGSTNRSFFIHNSYV